MARSYTLDTEAASQTSGGGNYIDQSGAYVGKLLAAFYDRNEKGTESMNLVFQSDSGQQVGPIALYTHNGKGEELPGYGAVNKLMTCLKVKTMEAKVATVDLYDFDAKRVVGKQLETYPALVGKPVGLLLRREEYEGRNGVKERMTVFGSFDPATRLMAPEILARKTEPAELDSAIDFLKREPVKPLKKGGRSSAAAAPSQASTAADDFADDDIPF